MRILTGIAVAFLTALLPIISMRARADIVLPHEAKIEHFAGTIKSVQAGSSTRINISGDKFTFFHHSITVEKPQDQLQLRIGDNVEIDACCWTWANRWHAVKIERVESDNKRIILYESEIPEISDSR